MRWCELAKSCICLTLARLYLQWLDGVVPVWFPGRADDEAPQGPDAAGRQYLPRVAQRRRHHHAQPHRQGTHLPTYLPSAAASCVVASLLLWMCIFRPRGWTRGGLNELPCRCCRRHQHPPAPQAIINETQTVISGTCMVAWPRRWYVPLFCGVFLNGLALLVRQRDSLCKMRNPLVFSDHTGVLHAVSFVLQLSGLQKYEELLTRINAEVAQRLLNIMPTVSSRARERK